MTTKFDEITQAVRDAIARRDSRRDVLAERLRSLAEDALDAARERQLDLGEAGMLKYRTPVADCSQWSNRIDSPSHEDEPRLLLRPPGEGENWRSFGNLDLGYFDGSNMQHQVGPAWERESGRRIRPATVAQLRAVARHLPTELGRLLDAARSRAEREAAEADAATETL